MPVATVQKQKRITHSRKTIKLPEGAPEDVEKTIASDQVDEKIIRLVDELMTSSWQPFSARPSRDLTGNYVIFRWFAKEQSWIPLYIGSGKVHSKLDAHFSGKESSPIGKYLSSFPRDARNKIWLKWLKDPYFPYESVPVKELTEVLANCYNGGQMPAFNCDDVKAEKPLPDDFSIVPDYQSSAAKKGKGRKH